MKIGHFIRSLVREAQGRAIPNVASLEFEETSRGTWEALVHHPCVPHAHALSLALQSGSSPPGPEQSALCQRVLNKLGQLQAAAFAALRTQPGSPPEVPPSSAEWCLLSIHIPAEASEAAGPFDLSCTTTTDPEGIYTVRFESYQVAKVVRDD